MVIYSMYSSYRPPLSNTTVNHLRLRVAAEQPLRLTKPPSGSFSYASPLILVQCTACLLKIIAFLACTIWLIISCLVMYGHQMVHAGLAGQPFLFMYCTVQYIILIKRLRTFVYTILLAITNKILFRHFGCSLAQNAGLKIKKN